MIRAGAVVTLALGLLAGCGEAIGPKQPSQVVAEVSSTISTVVHVRWKTAEPTIGYVEFGTTPQMELNTPIEATPTLDHAATLYGMTADTRYNYRVVTWDGAAAGASNVATIRTGNLPPGLPALTTTGSGQKEYIVTTSLGTESRAAIILNQEGKIVWYRQDERMLDFYRARISPDGKTLLYNAAKISGEPSQASELVRVPLDGSPGTSIPIPLLAHDFVELPDGTLAAIAFEYRDFQGAQLKGNKIVEVAPGGTPTTVWSSWDCFDPAVHQSDDLAQGWTFANALDYDPVANVYYLGMRNFSSITRINRQTKACEWVLGLSGSTFTFAPGSERFLHQHQFQVRGNRILIMDNEGAGSQSRLLEYELDLTNKVATQVWSYVSMPKVFTFVLGEPHRFDDNSVFINWSAAGQLERLDPSGTSIWKVNTAAGNVFGFHTFATSLYPANAQQPAR